MIHKKTALSYPPPPRGQNFIGKTNLVGINAPLSKRLVGLRQKNDLQIQPGASSESVEHWNAVRGDDFGKDHSLSGHDFALARLRKTFRRIMVKNRPPQV